METIGKAVLMISFVGMIILSLILIDSHISPTPEIPKESRPYVVPSQYLGVDDGEHIIGIMPNSDTICACKVDLSEVSCLKIDSNDEDADVICICEDSDAK